MLDKASSVPSMDSFYQTMSFDGTLVRSAFYMTNTGSNTSLPSIRYVVFHTPGPAWQSGVDFREQPSVQEHVAHYLQLYEQGTLELGGPFLVQDSGGMMVTVKGITYEEIESFAAADPAVQSGLLNFEIRPWYTVMERVS